MRVRYWFCFLLSACAPPLYTPPVNVQTESPELARAAAAAMTIGGENAQSLSLRENVSSKIESFDGDGTVSAYKMRYVLEFRLGEAAARDIALEQVVPVSESRYLAARHVRKDAIVRLRREALRQMRYILGQENP